MAVETLAVDVVAGSLSTGWAIGGTLGTVVAWEVRGVAIRKSGG